MSKRNFDRKVRRNLCMSFAQDCNQEHLSISEVSTSCIELDDITDDCDVPTFHLTFDKEAPQCYQFDNKENDIDEVNENIYEKCKFNEVDKAEELLKFMILFNISVRAMEHLLRLLVLFGLDVPKSVFMLQKNSRKCEIAPMPNESNQFAHFRIMDVLSFCIKKKLLKLTNSINDISLYVNIDGLPLFRSSHTGLWTILVKFKNSLFLKPMPLAVYYGTGKPDLSTFISPMVKELRQMCASSFKVENFTFNLKKIFFICDAPARAYIQCVKGHSAKDGCSYCRLQGIYSEKRLYFPHCSRNELDALTRENHQYTLHQETNQISLSPLADIVDLRNDFLPDYMHCVCLGIMKKMCTFFFSSVKGVRLRCKVGETQKRLIEERMDIIRPQIPKEFNRKLRSLSELEHFKAVEYRSLLLYFGPILFKDVVHTDFYRHFLLLHFSFYALCSPQYCVSYLENCIACIEQFCSKLSFLYENKFSSYNSHIVRHIPEFVSEHGPVDEWSTFCFENYLSILKRRLKCTNSMFQQTVKNLSVMANLFIAQSEDSIFVNEHEPNNCVMLSNGSMCIVNAAEGKTVINGTVLRFLEPLYSYPYCSFASFKIGFFTKTSKIVANEEIFAKCIMITNSPDRYLIIPMVSRDRIV